MHVYCFDFDGVICDSAGETGTAGWRAAAVLWPKDFSGPPTDEFLADYLAARPVLETGFESILLARLLADGKTADYILGDAPTLMTAVMAEHRLERETLIALYAETRDTWLANDLSSWLAANRFYPRIPEAITQLAANHPVFIITTKQHRYATALIEAAGIPLPPEHVFGLEAGKKPAVLAQLMARPEYAGATFHFYEDRLPALQKVAADTALDAIQLYLATWGYTTTDEIKAATDSPRITPIVPEDLIATAKTPANANDLLELTIIDVAYGGNGVAKAPDGMTIFVPFTAIGDQITARITHQKKRYAQAQLVELITPGQGRTKPTCPHYGVCGGCQYQHLTYDEQLSLKANQFRDALTRIGHLEDLPEITPVMPSTPYGYRNKIVLHPIHATDSTPAAYGFVTHDNTHTIPIDTCPIADQPLQDAIANLKPGDCRRFPITLRLAENGHVFRYYGKRPSKNHWLRESWKEHKLHHPLGSFAQVNPRVTRDIVEWLSIQLSTVPKGHLLDLFCGSGLFALTLGGEYRTVTGLEIDAESIKAARVSAKKWDMKPPNFIIGDITRRLPNILKPIDPTQCTVILDPPRAGCDSRTIRQLAEWKPQTIVYISCDATSQARDLKRLISRTPYRIVALALFDMFPQTAHFETVAILQPEE